MIDHPALQAWMLYGGLVIIVVGLGTLSWPHVRNSNPLPVNNIGISVGRDNTGPQTIYSGRQIVINNASPTAAVTTEKSSPFGIIFDPANPNRRFWSIEATQDQKTGKPFSFWEYRALVRNNSANTVRNVKVTVEAVGPLPTRPELSVFDVNRQQLIDLHPREETLFMIRRWFNPPFVPGLVIGGAYGPIKVTVSGDDVLPVTKLFRFDPSEQPMIAEIIT
jgi:hypothetical protein